MKNPELERKVKRITTVILTLWVIFVLAGFMLGLFGCEKNEPGIVPGCIACDEMTTFYYPGENPDHIHIMATQYFCNDSTHTYDAVKVSNDNTWKTWFYLSPFDSVLISEMVTHCHQFRAVCPQ